jgi:bifunctional oligoribonuclease and PAP phosphatase NrnA
MSSNTHLFGRLHEAVLASNRILLVAHKKPDGDALGSSSAMLNWCLSEGKDVTAFCLDAPSEKFRYIDHIDRFTTDQSVFTKPYDLVIVFDSGDLKYCGIDQLITSIPEGYLLVDVDHHATSSYFGHLNIVLPEASSTAEVMYRFFEENNIEMNEGIATSLMTGISTDTWNFANAKTNSDSMDFTSKLVSAGGRIQDILKYIWNNQSVDGLKVWGIMFARLNYNPAYDVVSTYILQSDLTTTSLDVTEPIANFLNSMVGDADTILVLKETPDGYVKGSFRSVGRNVMQVARLLGGGGHEKAAAFSVKGRIEVTEKGPMIVAA